ncbi:MAG: response regulator, partial [Anaerolineae bacterium]|nr:response regulator [Anaerolineae bacterium]
MDSPELRLLQKHIRKALNHLHDPSFLRASPLAAAWGVAGRFDTPAAVRGILVRAIEGLQPQPDEPPGSRSWEVYQSLYYRYVEQFAQDEVANQMGISLRQLRRLQQAGLEELTYRVSERLGQNGAAQRAGGNRPRVEQPQQAPPRGPLPRNHLPETPASAPFGDQAEEELGWLKASPPEETTDLGQVLPAAVDLVRSLARERGVSIEIALDDTVPHVVAHPVALRQALLNVLTVAVLSSPPASSVTVESAADLTRGEVRIASSWQAAGPLQQSDGHLNQHKLAFAQRLAELSAGRLQVVTEGQANRAVFSFPAPGQRLVLAIDDNALAVQLLQRYVVGTRYRIVGAQSAPEALALTRANCYDAIVVDVMMPNTDG